MSGYYGVSKSWMVYQRGKKKDWADWRRESASGDVLGSIFHDKRDETFDVTVWAGGKQVVSLKDLKGALWQMFEKADAAMKRAEGPRTLFNPRARKYKYHWYPASGAFWADAGMYFAKAKQERRDSRWFWLVAAKSGKVVARVGPAVPMSLSMAKREAEEVLLKLAPPSPRTLFNPVGWTPIYGPDSDYMFYSRELMPPYVARVFPLRERGWGWSLHGKGGSRVANGQSSSRDAAMKLAMSAFSEAKYRKPRMLFNSNDGEWEHRGGKVWRRQMARGHYLHAVESLGGNIWYWWVQVGKQVGVRKSSASFSEAKEQSLKAYRSLKLEPMLFNAHGNVDPRKWLYQGRNLWYSYPDRRKVVHAVIQKVLGGGRFLWAVRTDDLKKTLASGESRSFKIAERDAMAAYKTVAPPRTLFNGRKDMGKPKRVRRNLHVDLPTSEIFTASPYGLSPNAGRSKRHYKPRKKTFFVARFRPPYPQRGEFWTASTSIDTLPATVVGGVYQVSAPSRVSALAQARMAHERGR